MEEEQVNEFCISSVNSSSKLHYCAFFRDRQTIRRATWYPASAERLWIYFLLIFCLLSPTPIGVGLNNVNNLLCGSVAEWLGRSTCDQ